MSSNRFIVSVALVVVPDGNGFPQLRLSADGPIVAYMALGTEVDVDGAQRLAQAWIAARGQTLGPKDVDRVLAGAVL